MTPSSRLRTGVDRTIANPTYMWRVAATLLAIGATIGAFALLAPHPEEFNDRALWTNVVVSYLIALVCFAGADRFPTWPLHVILAISILAITRAAYDAGDPAGFYALFNVWIGLFAVFFFTRPAAIGYLVAIAIAYAWLLWHFDTSAGLARWITGMGTVALGAFMIDSLLNRVRKIADDNATIAAERERLMAALAEVARTDELTGLGNRRAWDEALTREIKRANRESTPLCIGIVDLDRFKEYNDRHGHLAGDRLLKQLAAAWGGQLRASDFLARYGGEEFALALPGCSLDDAVALTERLRAATPAGETCSAGVVLWNGEETGEELIERADRALYAAKDSGRDRIVAA
jgi:diguanylate cyclase (GGDEF)-like protein